MAPVNPEFVTTLARCLNRSCVSATVKLTISNKLSMVNGQKHNV